MKESNIKNQNYISRAFENGKLSHAYIIEGTALSGADDFAEKIAAALLCEKTKPGKPLFESPSESCLPQNRVPIPDEFSSRDNSEKAGAISCGSRNLEPPSQGAPCGRCPSCIKAASRNHPDIIYVIHEKPNLISVREIREQLVADIFIKPYYGPYKIYIIKDAELMNAAAQNALLKTLEEPPSYALILLLTNNADALLETIRSRSIKIPMERVSNEKLVASLLEGDGLSVYEIIKKLAGGPSVNSGNRNLKLHPGMDAAEINRAAKDLEEFDKDLVIKIFDFWLRDALVFLSTKNKNRLFFSQDKDIIEDVALAAGYAGLNRCLLAVREAEDELKMSVKAEAAYENLLLKIRREIKG